MSAQTGQHGEPTEDGSGGLVVPGRLVDLVAGLFLAAAGVGLYLVARSFDEVDNTGVGPATFPKGIAVLIVVTAVMLALRGAFPGLASAAQVRIGRPLAVFGAIALIAVFPALMAGLGYYPAMAIWMPALLLISGYTRPVGILLTTAGFLAFAKIAFELALSVRLS